VVQGRPGVLLSYKYSCVRMEPKEPKTNNTGEKPEEKEKRLKRTPCCGFPWN